MRMAVTWGPFPISVVTAVMGIEQTEVYAKLVSIAEDLVDYYRDKDALPAAKTQPCVQVAS